MMNHRDQFKYDEDRDVCELDVLDRSFLSDLLQSTKVYSYDGEAQLLDIIDSEASSGTEYLLLCSGKESIDTIINPLSITIDCPKAISSFDTVEGLLLVKMPSRTHAAAADEINSLIKEKLLPMGLYHAIQGFPGAQIRGRTSTRGKEPDYGWAPKRRPRQSGASGPKMPSVVIEVAATEKDEKLNLDVRYWLSPDDGNVKMCITLRVDRDNNEIRIESWIRQELENTPASSHTSRTRIYRNQVIYARMTKRGRPVLTGDYPFRIPFESLMLRPIDNGRAAENDLIFSKADLENLAESIWNAECY